MRLKEVLRLEVEAQSLHRKNWDGADKHTQEFRQSQSGESQSRCLCDLNTSWMEESSQKLARLHTRKSIVGSAMLKKNRSDQRLNKFACRLSRWWNSSRL